MTDIRAFKLKTGEEFIAEILSVSKDQSQYEIKNPCGVRLNENHQLQFVPWFPFSGNREFKFNSEDFLIAPQEVDDESGNAYKQTHGIGVVVPPTQKILHG